MSLSGRQWGRIASPPTRNELKDMIFKRIDKILGTAVIALALTGCMGVGDDLSGCDWGGDTGNTTLTFHYMNDAGGDIFTQNIGSVDAFIFDDRNLLVAHVCLDHTALDTFRGWKLNLPAGDYRAVCWANAASNSGFPTFAPGTTTLEQCNIAIDRSATATGDRVFYAPRKDGAGSRAGTLMTKNGDMTEHEFTVPSGQSVVKQMHFVRAYRTLSVYVQGFSDGGLPPVIEVTNLWGDYDFMLGMLGGKYNFTQNAQTVMTDGGEAMSASFHHAFGDVQHDMIITLRKASDNSVVCEINLKEFIDLNPAALKDDIEVLIEFSDLGVVVGIPGWLDRPITPGV